MPNPNMTYEELRQKLYDELPECNETRFGFNCNDNIGNFICNRHQRQLDELIQLFATLGAEVIESGRVDGMFIEWNGLNLADIKDMYAHLAQLTTKPHDN